MPRPRVAMRKIRDVLRLSFGEKLSRRQVSASLGIPVTTVSDHVMRAVAAGLSWPLPDELDDHGLEQLLFPPVVPTGIVRPTPDWKYVHLELRRKGVTLQLLWLEYREDHPDGYGYSQFANLYRAFRRQVDVVMRQEHRAGEKLFVDFAGQTIPIYDRRTGEVTLQRRAVRRRRRGVELPLRRGLRLPGAPVLGDRPHPRLRVHGGMPRDRGLRQPEIGRHPAAPLRAGRERHLPGDGGPLRRRGHPDSDLQAPGQGQGRSRSALGRALDNCPAATQALHLARRGQRRHRRVRGSHQLSPVQEAGRLTQDPVRGFGPPGAQATSARAL